MPRHITRYLLLGKIRPRSRWSQSARYYILVGVATNCLDMRAISGNKADSGKFDRDPGTLIWLGWRGERRSTKALGNIGGRYLFR